MTALATVALSLGLAASPDPAVIHRLIDSQCRSCHGAEQPPDLPALPLQQERAADWARVAHMLRTGQMPPPEEDRKMPPTAEARAERAQLRVAVEAWLGGAAPAPSRTTNVTFDEWLHVVDRWVARVTQRPGFARRSTAATLLDQSDDGVVFAGDPTQIRPSYRAVMNQIAEEACREVLEAGALTQGLADRANRPSLAARLFQSLHRQAPTARELERLTALWATLDPVAPGAESYVALCSSQLAGARLLFSPGGT